ncbi:hypothetical protein EV360DRAFT_77317, partial [Lentinula raphanica]
MTLTLEGSSCLAATNIPEPSKQDSFYHKVEIEEVPDEEQWDPKNNLTLDDPLLLHSSEVEEYYRQKAKPPLSSRKEQQRTTEKTPTPYEQSERSGLDTSFTPSNQSETPFSDNEPPENHIEEPKLKAPYISLIGAAPFQTLIKQGCEAYVLHIYPSKTEEEAVGLAANTTQPVEPRVSGVGVRDETHEAMKKHVPAEYHRF